jgi:hypothetical protein
MIVIDSTQRNMSRRARFQVAMAPGMLHQPSTSYLQCTQHMIVIDSTQAQHVEARKVPGGNGARDAAPALNIIPAMSTAHDCH